MTIYRAYCTCKTPEPEEIEIGLIVCLACKNEIERHEDAPEPDDMSEAPDLIDAEAIEKGYEDTRYEEASEDRSYAW